MSDIEGFGEDRDDMKKQMFIFVVQGWQCLVRSIIKR